MLDMGEKRLFPEQFFKYVVKPINRDEMAMWVKAHNINAQKSELFLDYIDSLLGLINETFLGDDVMSDDKSRLNHFKWCWNKTIDNFRKENVYFNREGEHYEYFWNLVYESFYIDKNKRESGELEKFFTLLFKLYILKSKSELDVLLELYNILDRNLTPVN
jgi:hypothetical protein